MKEDDFFSDNSPKEEEEVSWWDKHRTDVLYIGKLSIPIWVVLAIIIYYSVLCESDCINAWEKRLYVVIVILCVVLISFGILRLYNAVVANSTYLLRHKNSMDKVNKEIRSVSNELANNNRGINSSLKSFEKGIKTLTEGLKR